MGDRAHHGWTVRAVALDVRAEESGVSIREMVADVAGGPMSSQTGELLLLVVIFLLVVFGLTR
jgi:hypothetical protein